MKTESMHIMLYLDNAATTRRKPYGVYAAMLRYALCGGGNAGRGGSKLSLEGVRTIIETQEAAAELFGVKNESNIVFTQNATYALNMAILGVLDEKDNMTVTAMDHNSVLRPAALHGRYTVARADKTGYVQPFNVRREIKRGTKLVVCTHVSNVCGTLEPVMEIARTAHLCGALFLMDASQSAGAITINMEEIGADMIACPGHKGLMGPMGTGILCIRNPDKIRAIITGGTGSETENLMQPENMPDKFHSGTMNIPAIAGLKEGIRFVLREGADSIGRYEKQLSDKFRENIADMKGVILYGKPDTGITAFNIKGLDSSETAAQLGTNIIVRAGYHCAPLAHKALGTGDSGAVRASFGYFNSMSDVRKITDAVYKIVKNNS